MGTFGTYTGIIRWYDKVERKGHLMALQDGEVQSDITGDYWASGATGYDEGNGFWIDRQFTPGTTIAVGEPMGLLLALTYAAEVSSPATGVTRVFFGDSGGNKVTWDGNDLVIVGTVYATAGEFTGTVTATAGSFGGWTINSTYLAKDTGVDATSAGMAPLDYPFYSGATYANRAAAAFRVDNAGALVAEDATITGTINWASGKGVIDASGIAYDVDANNYLHVAYPATTFLDIKSSAAYAALNVYNVSTNAAAQAATLTGTSDAGPAVYIENKGTYYALQVSNYDGAGIKAYTGQVPGSYANVFEETYQGHVLQLIAARASDYALHTTVGFVRNDTFFEMPEISEPSAGGTNTARLYVKDNGSGKTQLCVRFYSGAVQVLATQP